MDTDFEGFTLEQLLQIVPPGARLEKAHEHWIGWRATHDALGMSSDAPTPAAALAGLMGMVYGHIEMRVGR